MSMLNTGIRVVGWIIWLWFFLSVFLYRLFLAAETPEATPMDIMFWAMLIFPTALCLFIRWRLIARFQGAMALYLPLMLVGIALAESLSFYGYFLFPQYQDLFFGLSLLLIIMYVPFYMHRKVKVPPPLPA